MKQSSLELYTAMQSVIAQEDPQGARELFGIVQKCRWIPMDGTPDQSLIKQCSWCGRITIPRKWWKRCPICGALIERTET